MTLVLPYPELGDAFAADRMPPDVIHLDAAAAGRASRSVLRAMSDHLDSEARLGGYIAQAEAADLIEQGRSAAAELLGFPPTDIQFTESATGALAGLLTRMHVPRGSTVLVAPGEYGPNLGLFRMFGLVVDQLPVADEAGHLDVSAVATLIETTRPAMVHLCLHPSHRGVVLDVAPIASICRAFGVPLVVDAAQGIAHLPTNFDADAVYATSRKWLCGPRGVGLIAVRQGLLPDGMPALESHEANIAGRVGLAVALSEHLSLGPEKVRERLGAIGKLTRHRLDGISGWSVIEQTNEPSAVTTLQPPAGWSDSDLFGFRESLAAGSAAERRIVTTYAGAERAPLQAKSAVLRISPHLDVRASDLDCLAEALRQT
ncbi:aminotransferase class V-fold PLP-dependent enzyme [Hoyosella altamirensis]|uniref:Probable hercynylcysteine sulfoxide lyase n=1 Tax=Hoyosella altamirensis TaxID=616997 RepID=A0A839RHI2_9ACTN|nr:aminotransferase class V-fold PLP-dependent enzyme [Hoyosella altamirensis]MBB3036065.1 pyridoxal 5-phosphate dependent beta-lyase [Hoyosella altamirensis]